MHAIWSISCHIYTNLPPTIQFWRRVGKKIKLRRSPTKRLLRGRSSWKIINLKKVSSYFQKQPREIPTVYKLSICLESVHFIWSTTMKRSSILLVCWDKILNSERTPIYFWQYRWRKNSTTRTPYSQYEFTYVVDRSTAVLPQVLWCSDSESKDPV